MRSIATNLLATFVLVVAAGTAPANAQLFGGNGTNIGGFVSIAGDDALLKVGNSGDSQLGNRVVDFDGQGDGGIANLRLGGLNAGLGADEDDDTLVDIGGTDDLLIGDLGLGDGNASAGDVDLALGVDDALLDGVGTNGLGLSDLDLAEFGVADTGSDDDRFAIDDFGGPALVASTAGIGIANPACSLREGRQVISLASRTQLNRALFQHVGAVQVVPVRLCGPTRAKIAAAFGRSDKIQLLQRAIAGSAELSAQINGSGHSAGDVFAVSRNGPQLTVYVF